MNGKKLSKIILIIILILLLLVVIHTVRNYIILTKIATKQEEISKLTNYSYTMNFTNLKTNEKATIKYCRKDNKSITIMGDNIIWYDADTDEQISMKPKELTATVAKNSETAIQATLPIQVISNDFVNKLGQAMFSFITYDMVGNEKCYEIQSIIGATTTIPYVSVEDGTLLKLITGKIKNSNDYQVAEYTDWKLNEITDEDVTRPNLTGYEVTNVE